MWTFPAISVLIFCERKAKHVLVFATFLYYVNSVNEIHYAFSSISDLLNKQFKLQYENNSSVNNKASFICTIENLIFL